MGVLVPTDYYVLSWDSLDLCELASKENLYPAFSVQIRAHPWDIISHWLHWFTLNQGYLFPLRDAQKESFEPLGEIRNLNYLNFSPWARNVLFCAQQVVGFMLFKLLLTISRLIFFLYNKIVIIVSYIVVIVW